MTKKKSHEEKVKELEQSYVPISLASIQTELADIEREETYIVEVNGNINMVIKYNPVFDQNKINKIISEVGDKVRYAEENKINFLKTEYELVNYLYFMIVKNFTHFKDEIADDLETQIVQMDALVKLGYLELIIGEVFNPKEIYRVLDKVMQLAEYADKVKNAEMEAKDKASKLENKAKAIQKSTKTKSKKK